MSVSPLDALMQMATPTRASEPSSRGGDQPAFGPALEQAYQAETPRPTARPQDQAEDDSLEAPSDDSTVDYDEAASAEQEHDSTVESPVAGEEEAMGEEEAEDGDAVEITEEGEEAADEAAASAAVIVTAAVEPLVVAIAVAEAGSADDGAEGTVEAAAPPTGNVEQPKESSAGASSKRAQAETELAAVEAAQEETPSAMYLKSVIDHGQNKRPAQEQESKQGVDAAADAAAEVDGEAGTHVSVGGTAKELVADSGKSAPEAKEPKADAGDRTEQVALPPVEPKAELVAAVERHIAAMEAAATNGSEPVQQEPATAVEPAAGNAQAPRGAATLERLSAGSLRRADAPANSDNGPPIDRMRFVQRVEGAMKAAQQRDGRVQVRLAPPELGALRIELAVQNGVMSAKLEAETSAARNALLDNLPALRERLAEQNIRVEKFDVDIRQDSKGGSNNGPHDRPGERGEAGSQERRDRPAPATAKMAGGGKVRPPAAASSQSGLDVRV